jgi:biopolymer transport protein ExbB
MKKLFTLGLALLCLAASSSSWAGWNADWTKRAKIGLNTAADGLPLQAAADSVPLLVRLHTGNFSFVDAKADGSDLRFIAADDKTPLKFHVEKFDGLNELALVWVQVPKLAPGSNADFIWVYYGNDKAPPASDSKTFYDAGQALVYHFGDAQPLPLDATANANTASTSTAKPGAAGLIGADVVFDGNAQIQINASPSLKAGVNGATVSFWVKPKDLADATLFAQPGAAGLHIALQGGKLVAQVGALATQPGGTPAAGAWQHVAVVVKDGLVVYLDGVEVGKVAGSVVAADGGAVIGQGFKGEIDEFEIASTARSASWIKVAALSQGPEQKLLVYGQAEGGADSGGPSTLHILLSAVTLDGWIVIGILIVMFVISVLVMVTKTRAVIAASRDNDRFKSQFETFIDSIKPGGADASAEKAAASRFRNSSLYRLYAVGAHELRARFVSYAEAGHHGGLTDQTINAIRSTIDARMVRETQQLNSRMVLLTIAIAGGPFLGLLGTVVGVMITFAAIAAAGDVNVNAIAPGIAAALVATVAGLAVAIPALFGYNYLGSRISELNSDMQVFVDEFISRIAEKYSL